MKQKEIYDHFMSLGGTISTGCDPRAKLFPSPESIRGGYLEYEVKPDSYWAMLEWGNSTQRVSGLKSAEDAMFKLYEKVIEW